MANALHAIEPRAHDHQQNVIFYHRTIVGLAYAILAEGFRDYDVYEGKGDMLRGVHAPRGVRIADRPVSLPVRRSDAAIVEIALDQRLAQELDLVKVVRGNESYHECVVPASLLNRCGAVRLLADEGSGARSILAAPKRHSMSNTTRSIAPSNANGARR